MIPPIIPPTPIADVIKPSTISLLFVRDSIIAGKTLLYAIEPKRLMMDINTIKYKIPFSRSKYTNPFLHSLKNLYFLFLSFIPPLLGIFINSNKANAIKNAIKSIINHNTSSELLPRSALRGQ